jgi:hypothetical protein
MDEATRLRMRRGHLKHVGYCTFGFRAHGNGGKYAHREMHRRRGDGHTYLIQEEWERRFPRTRPVTDVDLDAPDGATVDGYVRRGDQWLRA